MAKAAISIEVHYNARSMEEDIRTLIESGLSIEEAIATLPLGKYISISMPDAASNSIKSNASKCRAAT